MRKVRSTVALTAIAAAMLSTNASAVNIASDGIGEVAIAPYYTVRDGWQTLINLTNTQNVPVVVKVRLHEAYNSRDVLDFNVALSSFDVFSAVIREADNGSGPVLVVTDQADDFGRQTCTIPTSVATAANGTPLSTQAFGPANTSDDDGGPQDVDRLREGYVEFIVMGYADASNRSGNANQSTTGQVAGAKAAGTLIGSLTNLYGAIESHNCNVVQSAFGNANIVTTAQQFGEPINALKFNFRLLNPGRGVESGSAATTWANFYNPLGDPDNGSPAPGGAPAVAPVDNSLCAITRGDERNGTTNWVPDGSDGASCLNLITAQTAFPFLEPTLNDAFPPVANWWDDAQNFAAYARPTTPISAPPGSVAAVEDVRGVDALSLTIQRSAIINEWSSNQAQGVTTDWIVTLPTKGFYVDGGRFPGSAPGTGNLGPGIQSALVPGARDEAFLIGSVPYPPFENPFGQTVEGVRASAAACNEVAFAVYDRAEQALSAPPVDDVVVSPAPPPVVDTDELCYEANVITFNGQSALNPANPLSIVTDGSDGSVALTAEAGWMLLDLTASGLGIQAEQTAGDFAGGTDTVEGLPAIGFLIKQRNFGDVTKNFASQTDHGYQRAFTP